MQLARLLFLEAEPKRKGEFKNVFRALPTISDHPSIFLCTTEERRLPEPYPG